MKTKMSKMMNELYGDDYAKKVYQRCEELGTRFNELVQNLVYNEFWSRPGLTLKEKSLITIVSLMALHKEEQLTIHLQGFLHLGGNNFDIKLIEQRLSGSDYVEKTTLNKRDIAFIDLAACIAYGDQEKTKKCMRKLLEEQILSRDDIENTMLHQIIYCGFPCAMNGYAVLKTLNKLAL